MNDNPGEMKEPKNRDVAVDIKRERLPDMSQANGIAGAGAFLGVGCF